ncbi:MAG TPA: ABC transporter substrate-binding protein [Bacillota bacterium]|nr:ABC transporter substrate-binding protein [Bacillota bacterium]HOH09954.1 ABC transporter substrate-binding protein [Bacillota bacterium]
MKRAITLLVLAAMLGLSVAATAAPKMQLMVYTSMKEVLISELIDAFLKKNPSVRIDYYSAGAGKLMAKIATEKQANALVCDVLWTSEVPDFYQMKAQGALEPYVSPEAKNIVSPVKDKEGYFTPARLGTLGVAYNTNKVKNPPKTWEDLLKPEFKDGFAIANPALSGTSMVSVGMIVENLGWEYIQKLRGNGALMGQGSGQVVDDTAIGDLKACQGVDYIVINKIKEGASLGFTYLDKMLVIPSPVAILKGTKNLEAAKLWVDFMLSKEGQSIIANSFTLPIRADVPIVQGVGLVTPAEAEKRAMKLDYIKLMSDKEATIEKFTSIMTK